MTLADAGTPNTDASYGGETGESKFSLQYYRNKAREFQAMMDALDQTAASIRVLLDAGVSPDDADELQMWLAEFEGKKFQFRAVAEAINAGSMLINSAGGRFPVMVVPQTLAALPLALPLAAIAALGVAATLISWGADWMRGVNRRMHDQRMLDAITDPAEKARAAEAVLRANSALAATESSPLAMLATVAKWGVIALLAYKGYQLIRDR